MYVMFMVYMIAQILLTIVPVSLVIRLVLKVYYLEMLMLMSLRLISLMFILIPIMVYSQT